MLKSVPPPLRTRDRPPKSKAKSPSPPVPVGPTLTEADFDADEGLTLFFDRDVALTTFDGTATVVNDPASESTYVGTGATVESGFIVRITVDAAGPSSGTDATLTANADSGIVAADSGVAWAGVSGFALAA